MTLNQQIERAYQDTAAAAEERRQAQRVLADRESEELRCNEVLQQLLDAFKSHAE